jgi:hypothetical protein
MNEQKLDLMRLKDYYPPIIGRSQIGNFFPGVLNSKTLANFESQGLGIPKYKIGKRVFYFIEDILRYIEMKAKN